MDKSAAVAILRAESDRMKRKLIIFGAVLLAIGIALAVGGFESTGSDRSSAWAAAAFFILIGILLVWAAIAKFSSAKSPMVIALGERPREVVWFYRNDYVVNGVKSPNRGIAVCYSNGKSSTLIVWTSRVDNVMSAIRCLAPHAVEGFSEERAARFKRDPSSFALS